MFRFLKCSRLNDLRNDYDPSQTFEGENHMVIQQTSNYLLSAFLDKKKGEFIEPKARVIESTSFKGYTSLYLYRIP